MAHLSMGWFTTKLPASNIDSLMFSRGSYRSQSRAKISWRYSRRRQRFEEPVNLPKAKLITSYGKPHKPWEYTGNYTYNDMHILLYMIMGILEI